MKEIINIRHTKRNVKILMVTGKLFVLCNKESSANIRIRFNVDDINEQSCDMEKHAHYGDKTALMKNY